MNDQEQTLSRADILQQIRDLEEDIKNFPQLSLKQALNLASQAVKGKSKDEAKQICDDYGVLCRFDSKEVKRIDCLYLTIQNNTVVEATSL